MTDEHYDGDGCLADPEPFNLDPYVKAWFPPVVVVLIGVLLWL